MSKYELMFICKAQLDEKKQGEIIEKAKSVIETNSGKVVDAQLLGKKPLAVRFKNQSQGIYVSIGYEATGNAANKALNDFFKITEDAVRHIILKQEQAKEKAPRKAKRAKTAEVVEKAE